MAGPSNPSSGRSYDVFLNFRGEDTRNTFSSHLYNALDDAGFHTFKDNERLRTGEEIGPKLLSAIQKSRISIPIFSKNYASSKWCLKELVKMIECRKTVKQLVLPIFYDVDPSIDRNRGYAEALRIHSERFDQTIVEEWKQALREVANLKGWELSKIANGDEGKLVKLVVADISNKLRKGFRNVSDVLIGIESHVEKMMSLLNIESEDVKIVGVLGLGGLGKTTIAKVVYNKILHHFEGCAFLENVRETSQHYGGLVDLQKRLVSAILKGASLNITDKDDGINEIGEKFRNKKVLIVLDDADEKVQLDALVGERDWFDSGSRIIITTRNEHLLTKHGVNEVYEPNEMNLDQSLQLFSRHAFGRDHPPEDYLNLSKDIVANTGGLPLAVEVIGSSLPPMRKPVWQDTLKMLQDNILHDKVRQKLKISYDVLNEFEKEIFLDIACFFSEMDKTIACFIWQQCNLYPEAGVEALRQKSLVKIGENNELKMHDLLRDLGKEIIRQENPVSGQRSRLWSTKEALGVLDKKEGTDKVKGLCIDFGGSSRSLRRLTSEGFTNMTKLRLLQVDYADFAPELVPSFSELIWFRWKGCPLESMLTKFYPVNLVVLDLSYSLVTKNWKGWKRIKVAKNLKVLNLTGCQYLRQTPKLGNCSLEVLILENCENLGHIHESINYLEGLVTLNMRGCSKLEDLPYEIGGLTSLRNLNLHQCEGLAKLPDSIGLLKNLETFDASFCSINDKGIPEALGWLSSLEILKLGGNNFHRLPVTVSSLSSLQTLDLRFCNNLKSLPELPSSLKILNVLRCGLTSFPRPSNLTNVEVLCFDDCEKLLEMPDLVGLTNLKKLILDNCQSLTEIGGLTGLDSLELLIVKNCGSLVRIGRISSLRKLKDLRFTDCFMLSEIEGLVGLDSLELFTMNILQSLRKIGKISGLRKLKELRLTNYSILSEIESLEGLDSLELLIIKECRLLRKVPMLFDLKKLRELEIEGCSLIELAGLVGLDSLEILTIKNCRSLMLIERSNLKKLRVLRMEYLEISVIQGLEKLDSLKMLTIKSCQSLYKMPNLSALKKLRMLEIWDCGNLRWIDLEDLKNLISLEKLSLHGCPLILLNWSTVDCNITKIEGQPRLEFLETLEIKGCTIERLDLSYLRSLKHLSIAVCHNLKEIQCPVRLEYLERLDISCNSVKSFPDVSNFRNLKHLSAANLNKYEGLDALESLESLEFSRCRSMVRLQDLSNLKNLKRLSTTHCYCLKDVQGLVGLESLETLGFYWCFDLESLPDLSNFRNLKYLYTAYCFKLKEVQGLDVLDTLEVLDFSSCRSMERLPDLSNLRSLKHLSTSNCYELKELQGVDGLESLESLDITGCVFKVRPDLSNLRNSGVPLP